MSSKKQIRQERRRKKREKKKGKLNPAVLFVLGVGLALLAIVLASYFFGSEPPRPDAVWSPEHQHWH